MTLFISSCLPRVRKGSVSTGLTWNFMDFTCENFLCGLVQL